MMLCGLHTARYFMQTHVQILPLTQLSHFIFWAINFFFCPDVKSKSPFQGAICPLTCPQQYPLSSNAFLKMTIPSKVWMYRASASLKFLRNCFSNMPQKRSYLDIFLNPQQMHFCTFRWLYLECYTKSWGTLINKTNSICSQCLS